jgi:electron transfer flavoprotein alpha subunit
VILAIVEHSGGTVERASLAALAMGRQLATMLGVPLSAVAFGPGAASALAALGPAGVGRAWAVEAPLPEGYAPAAWARCAGQLAGAVGAQVVVAAGTGRGNEVMAHVAAQLGLPMAANCVEVGSVEPFVVIRQRWGGSVLEEARLDASMRCLTVAENTQVADAEPAAADRGPVPVESFAPTNPEAYQRVRVARHVPRESAGIPLAGARVVVGGGRGVGSAAGFGPLDELAALLGGAVGVSRVVTSAGWRPHAEQVGQTGTRSAAWRCRSGR